MDQQHGVTWEPDRNTESQTPPQTHWVGVYILIKSLGDLKAQYSVRNGALIKIKLLFPFPPMVSLASQFPYMSKRGWKLGTHIVLCSLFSCNMFLSFSPMYWDCRHDSPFWRASGLLSQSLCCILGPCPTFLLFTNVAAVNISIHVPLGLVP